MEDKMFWIISIVAGLIFGAICAGIASSKNRNAASAFFGGFFFGIIAVIVHLLLKKKESENSNDLFCPECNTKISESDKFCPKCGIRFVKQTISCPKCHKENDLKNKFCSKCGADIYAEEETILFTITCLNCNKKFDINLTDKEIKSIKKKKKIIVTCPHCQEDLELEPSDLEKHFDCDYCNHSFKTETKLEAHLKTCKAYKVQKEKNKLVAFWSVTGVVGFVLFMISLLTKPVFIIPLVLIIFVISPLFNKLIDYLNKKKNFYFKSTWWKRGLIVLVLVIISIVIFVSMSRCPSSCKDNYECTNDFCSEETNFTCIHEDISPCIGNGICEQGERTSKDCKDSCIEDKCEGKEFYECVKDNSSEYGTYISKGIVIGECDVECFNTSDCAYVWQKCENQTCCKDECTLDRCEGNRLGKCNINPDGCNKLVLQSVKAGVCGVECAKTSDCNEGFECKNNVCKSIYFDDDLAEFAFDFWDKTDLQRDELWKTFKNKRVLWTIYIDSVDKDLFGNNVILGSASKSGPYDFSSDVTVQFPDSARSQLLKLKEDQIITISADLDSYENWLKQLVVDNAKIVETREPTRADVGPDSEMCIELQDLCSAGDYGACTTLMELQSDDTC